MALPGSVASSVRHRERQAFTHKLAPPTIDWNQSGVSANGPRKHRITGGCPPGRILKKQTVVNPLLRCSSLARNSIPSQWTVRWSWILATLSNRLLNLFHTREIPNLATSHSRPIGLFHTYVSLILARLHSPVLHLYRMCARPGSTWSCPVFWRFWRWSFEHAPCR